MDLGTLDMLRRLGELNELVQLLHLVGVGAEASGILTRWADDLAYIKCMMKMCVARYKQR